MSKLITPTPHQRIPLTACRYYKCCATCANFVDGMTCKKTGKLVEETNHCKKFEGEVKDMARYANTDKLKTDILMKYKKHWEVPCSSEDRLIQSIVTDLRVLIEKNTTADVAPRAEVIEEYRKKVYAKMEKYTVFGREYIQRIMREVEKEMKGGE